jgi:hypothetical protein
MKILAGKAGLEVRDVEFDSTEFQFWASEQYRQNVPLKSEASYAVNPQRSMFTPAQISSYRRKAAELNQQDNGDSASFFLVKS